MANLQTNKEQDEAQGHIFEGHHLLITGQAGTGKTQTIKSVYHDLKACDKDIALLCTTGIGCLQYVEIGAATVHSWAGLCDGRYDNLTLENLVLKDEKYDKVRENARKCDIILLDEISMLSKKDFEQLELVCRLVRGNNIIFGGIQVVASGDFYQLPPVPNHLYNDSGQYCFESELWKKVFIHKFNLQTVVRQTEQELINAVRDTARGSVSLDCEKFLKNLNKIPDNVNSVHLFPKNIDAAIFNNEQLNLLHAEERVYAAIKNQGPLKYLKRILAPQYLRLKIGCPVMLLRNIGGKLVNGLCGYVKAFQTEKILVQFPAIKQIHWIERYDFSVFSMANKSNVAERKQFPLQLAYGLTIHKSQGMTLNYVTVHCKGIFEAGQLSVAIGRATNSKGLCLLDFRKGLCYQPKHVVTEFYGQISDPFSENIYDCCRNKYHVDLKINNEDPMILPTPTTDGSDESDFDDTELDFLEKIDVYYLPQLPFKTSVDKLVNSIMIENPITETQTTINDICASLDLDFVEIFLSKQFEHFKDLIPSDTYKTCTSVQDWTNILSKYNSYVTSQDFMKTLPLLYQYETSLSSTHKYIGSLLVNAFLKTLVHQQAESVTLSLPEPVLAKHTISEPGKAKVRYVGGMCVAKTRQKCSNSIYSKLGDPRKNVQSALKKAQSQVQFLHSLEASQEEIDITDISYQEIERQQNITRCLTYINEKCFHFFLLLNEKLHHLLNLQVFAVEKGNIFEYIKNALKSDDDLRVSWSTICEGIISLDDSEPVFDEFIRLFMMVGHKQFLKDTKSNFNILKKKRHRKQIMEKSAKSKMEISISLQDIAKDTSNNKETSHLKLKLNSISNKGFFNSRLFTKKDLEKICKAYDCHCKQTMKKEDIADNLCNAIISSNSMKNPSIFSSEPAASTSSSSSSSVTYKKLRATKPSKGKGRGKGRNSKKYYCGKCAIEYKENEDWIQCDDCNKWFHRLCGEINEDIQWHQLQIIDVEWICPSCSQERRYILPFANFI